MNDDEEFLFQQEMEGVEPLKRSARVKLKREEGNADSLELRRTAAVAEQVDRNLLSDEGIEPLDPWYVLDYKLPGVQNGVFRKLKQGRYEAEARLNLHRMSVKNARQEVFEFIEHAQALGLRTVLLIHGKGQNSPGRGSERERTSVIKGFVNHWLQQLSQVLAFHSARPRHGGTGAVYVLLRKDDDAKQANRERFKS
jgi:DNA-nicking Smr family endonuclease